MIVIYDDGCQQLDALSCQHFPSVRLDGLVFKCQRLRFLLGYEGTTEHRCHSYPRSSPLQWWDLPFFASCWCSLRGLWTREAGDQDWHIDLRTWMKYDEVMICWSVIQGITAQITQKDGWEPHFLQSIGHDPMQS